MFIRNFNSFKNHLSKINEGITPGPNQIIGVINLTFKPALEKLSDKPNVKEIIKWLNDDLLNSKSNLFLFKPVIDELNSFGSSQWNKSESVEGDRFYWMDESYIKVMDFPLSENSSLLGKKEANVKIYGLSEMSKLCDAKFGDNKMPWMVIKYCLTKVRSMVATEVKYLPYEQRSKDAGGKISEGSPEYDSKIPINCFLNEDPSAHLPELKKILIACGGRDLWDKNKKPAEISVIMKPIAVKKKSTFINYFKGVLEKFPLNLKKITEKEISDFLKKNKIGSDEVVYNQDDEVVYLRKDKTIDDWNKLSDEEKSNLESDTTKEIVGKGKITSVDGDNFEIEYSEGKKAKKNKSEIIKKVD